MCALSSAQGLVSPPRDLAKLCCLAFFTLFTTICHRINGPQKADVYHYRQPTWPRLRIYLWLGHYHRASLKIEEKKNKLVDVLSGSRDDRLADLSIRRTPTANGSGGIIPIVLCPTYLPCPIYPSHQSYQQSSEPHLVRLLGRYPEGLFLRGRIIP